MLPERSEPTHILRIDVPLNTDELPTEFDAVAEALKIALALSRAATAGVICDDPQVSLIGRLRSSSLPSPTR